MNKISDDEIVFILKREGNNYFITYKIKEECIRYNDKDENYSISKDHRI